MSVPGDENISKNSVVLPPGQLFLSGNTKNTQFAYFFSSSSFVKSLVFCCCCARLIHNERSLEEFMAFACTINRAYSVTRSWLFCCDLCFSRCAWQKPAKNVTWTCECTFASFSRRIISEFFSAFSIFRCEGFHAIHTWFKSVSDLLWNS